jgi:hypothetical protein
MTVNSSGKENDRMYCREQVGKTIRAFRISTAFAPPSARDGLLALYALFSVIEQICSSVTDESVARDTLQWWRAECLHKPASESLHPLIRELNRNGLASRLPRASLENLFRAAESRLDADAPPEPDALKILCMETQQPQVELEAASAGISFSDLGIGQRQLARAGLLQLIRESTRHQNGGAYWWLPLNSLARHGLRRDQIESDPGCSAVRAVFAELFASSGKWGGEAEEKAGESTIDLSQARHLFAIHGVYSNIIKRLETTTPDLYAEKIQGQGVVDLFQAWNCARRMQWR